jgi:hypothetical protein
MVKELWSLCSWPSNPQASLIPSAAKELTLVKVSSMANVRSSSAAIFSVFFFLFLGGVGDQRRNFEHKKYGVKY